MKDCVHICMIAEESDFRHLAVALTSILESRKNSAYNFHFVGKSFSEEFRSKLQNFTSPEASIEFCERSCENIANLKPDLPNLFPGIEKILYLDNDIICQIDLGEFYQFHLGNQYAAVVADCKQIFRKVCETNDLPRPFDDGVMLLNLGQMRKENVSEKLSATLKKQKCQDDAVRNSLNVVLNGHVAYFPIRYNFHGPVLARNTGLWSISQINHLYNTHYAYERDFFGDFAILHFSGPEKPWENPDMPFGPLWRHIEAKCNILGEKAVAPIESPLVSVIVPCYNVEDYVGQALDSVLSQNYKNIEIVCLDDGSKDGTAHVLQEYAARDSRVRVYLNSNHRQGWERNQGIELARGKYVYYMDSDDLLVPGTFSKLVSYAEENNADLLFFEADSFYENESLRAKYPGFLSSYHRKYDLPAVYRGDELYFLFLERGGPFVSPCLQFVRRDLLLEKNIRFPELKTQEDNVYVQDLLFAARRAIVFPDSLYRRRVRAGSTMTSTTSAIERSEAIGAIIHHYISRADHYGTNSRERNLLIRSAIDQLRWYEQAIQNDSFDRAKLESAIDKTLSAHELIPEFLHLFDLKDSCHTVRTTRKHGKFGLILWELNRIENLGPRQFLCELKRYFCNYGLKQTLYRIFHGRPNG